MPASLFSQHPKANPARFNNPTLIALLIKRIQVAASKLHRLSEADLNACSDRLTESVCGGTSLLEESILVPGLALMAEAIRRCTGKSVYDVQLHAALLLASGSIVEMQTGEGKTLSVGLAAYLHAIRRRGIHVVTSNAYLARRDCRELAPAFEILGMTCGFLPEGNNVSEKRLAYECDLTYGTGYEFGFDYLRDQVQIRGQRNIRLGEKCLSNCNNSNTLVNAIVQRGLSLAIIDEVDNVLLDDACSPLVLSGSTATAAIDEQAHRRARQTAIGLKSNHDFRFDGQDRRIVLTESGIQAAHTRDLETINHVLQRPWIDYIEQALQAEWLFHRDVHYILRDAKVQLVDGTTGRVFEDRKWTAGLHQAVEAKEGLPITCETQPLARVTRQRLYGLYHNLTGLTGTAIGGEAEFSEIYRLRVNPVPLRVPSRRRIESPRFFVDATARSRAIVAEIVDVHRAERPVLIGTRSIAETRELSTILGSQHIAHQVLNGVQDSDEAAMIADAGVAGAVTISTNMAGRGTDIRLTPEAVSRGGLHVIICGRHESNRIDRQLMGRGARQGDPGSARLFCSGDDWLVQSYSPWVPDTLRRHADRHGEVAQDFSVAFDRAQRICERQQRLIRTQLYQEDRRRDEVMAKIDMF